MSLRCGVVLEKKHKLKIGGKMHSKVKYVPARDAVEKCPKCASQMSLPYLLRFILVSLVRMLPIIN